MKEYQSRTGGRPLYSSDIKNLQELALSFVELFKDCNIGFVLSGCTITKGGSAYTLSEGYVYLDGKIRHVEASSVASLENLKIVSKERDGDVITYNDSNDYKQYIDYYAVYQSTSDASSAYIEYNSSTSAWPNIRTAFMNYYAATKNTTGQVLRDLSINDYLKVGGQIQTGKEVNLSDLYYVNADDKGIYFESKTGGMSIEFGNDSKVYYKTGDTDTWTSLFEISSDSDTGKTTVHLLNDVVVDALTVQQKSSGYIGVPIGGVQIFAGAEDKIPSDYVLCDGRELSKTTYAKLYNVIGDMYNTTVNEYGSSWYSPKTGNFRVPDLRGKFLVGYAKDKPDYYMGKTGGEEKHCLKLDEMPSHRHVYTDDINAEGKFASLGFGPGFPVSASSVVNSNSAADKEGSGRTYYTSYAGGNSPHENRPPYFSLAYIIRVK